MAFNNKGQYQAVAGAETAAAGNVIASATWDSIHSDIRSALTACGQGQFSETIGGYAVNVAASVTGDTILVIPTSIIPSYQVLNLSVFSVGTNPPTAATRIGLFTGAAGTGVTVIPSTNSTLPTATGSGVNGNIVSVAASVVVTVTQLYVNIAVASTSTCTLNFYAWIRPIPTS